jgi:hypothetical protein
MFPMLSEAQALDVAKRYGMIEPEKACRLNVFKMLLNGNPKIACAVWNQGV